MIKVGPNLISKELAGVQQILKANDEYLKQNEYLGRPTATKKVSEEPELFDFEDSEE